MANARIIRPVPLLCKLGIHWREWTASIITVDITPTWRFHDRAEVMEGKLHVSRGCCRRCSDMISFYTVYDVEDAL